MTKQKYFKEQRLKECYEKLYALGDTKDIDLAVLLPDIPTLSYADSELIEGKIACAEKLGALSKMKNK